MVYNDSMLNDDQRSRFKESVRANFDQSVETYDRFEEKHRLFQDLSNKLLDLIGPWEPQRILDVGCGTGVSTLALHRSFPVPPAVYAIDISESMLIKARQRCKEIPGIFFFRGDAENLESYFRDTFDAVFYMASIFLMPNFARTLSQACNLLVPGGVIAISYYDGLFDASGNDAVRQVFPDLRYRYGAVPLAELLDVLNRRKDHRVTLVDYFFEITREFLLDFLSIPAQSASLFPKLAPPDRLDRARDFGLRLAEDVRPLFMGWKLIVSRRQTS